MIKEYFLEAHTCLAEFTLAGQHNSIPPLYEKVVSLLAALNHYVHSNHIDNDNDNYRRERETVCGCV